MREGMQDKSGSMRELSQPGGAPWSVWLVILLSFNGMASVECQTPPSPPTLPPALPCAVGGAHTFTGAATSYLTATSRTGLVGGGLGFTLCAWIYRTRTGSAGDRVIDFGNGADNTIVEYLYSTLCRRSRSSSTLSQLCRRRASRSCLAPRMIDVPLSTVRPKTPKLVGEGPRSLDARRRRLPDPTDALAHRNSPRAGPRSLPSSAWSRVALPYMYSSDFLKKARR